MKTTNGSLATQLLIPKFLPLVGAHLTLAQAQRYGEALIAVREREGAITPELLVNEASNGSILAEWIFRHSKEEAVQRDRLSEARFLILNIGRFVRLVGRRVRVGKIVGRLRQVQVSIEEGGEQMWALIDVVHTLKQVVVVKG